MRPVFRVSFRIVIFLACFFLNNQILTYSAGFLLNSVIEKHISQLKNLDTVYSNHVFISFSATPGMGKTFVAQKIESELKAVRINLDEGRMLLKQNNLYPVLGSEKDKIKCIIDYLNKLLLRLDKISRNRLIIIDDSVDRMYEPFLAIANQYNASLYVIKLDVSKKTAIKRIKMREEKPRVYLENIDRWYTDYLRFDQKRVDFVFDNEAIVPGLSISLLIKKILNVL